MRHQPLTPLFGAEVQDMDLKAPLDEAACDELRRLWDAYGVLLWRGPSTPEIQVRLSEVFGRCQKHISPEMWVQDFPILIAIKVTPDDESEENDIYRVDGQDLAGFRPWHRDLHHQLTPNRGSMLRGVVLPAEGGDTGFVDGASAYDRLPASTKARIDDLRVINAVIPNPVRMRYRTEAQFTAVELSARVRDYDQRAFEQVSQPLVYVQKGTGRKILTLSPWFAVGVEGMAQAEADVLLQDLTDHLIAPEHIYVHKWRQDDLLLWDNWRMAHKAFGAPAGCTRELHRTTLYQDWELGRPARAASEALGA